MKAKPTGTPHPFVADAEVPADHLGRGVCLVCHLVGQSGDAHHTLPEIPAQAAVLARYEPGDDE
jgi:hypothetical protein